MAVVRLLPLAGRLERWKGRASRIFSPGELLKNTESILMETRRRTQTGTNLGLSSGSVLATLSETAGRIAKLLSEGCVEVVDVRITEASCENF